MIEVTDPKPAYRPDIDGLRALAVLAVVWFHAFPRRLPGGFVGVDIFFVISGFLISTILLREIRSKSYRYSLFMARRIRRIFPALATVLLSTLLAGWFLLSDSELVSFSKELIAGSLFFANILYWTQEGYFNAASEFKPLLHLWSLGVEEQFYIFYPPLLWLIFRGKLKPYLTLALVFLTSFICSVLATKAYPGFAFFMLPSRFWELLCGAFIALWLSRDKRSEISQTLAHTFSVIGVTLMLAAIGLIKEEDFPGFWALMPTLGASLFILAGPRGFFNRYVFALRPMVAVGLISYPLYLWHWPLISFGHILAAARPPETYLKLAIAAAIGLSILTYHLIEKPLRHTSIPKTYKFLAPLALIAALLGALIIGCKGFPNRTASAELVVNQGEIDHLTFHKYGNAKFFPCEQSPIKANALDYEGTIRCHQSKKGNDYDLILLGDSHAEHLFYGLAEVFPEKNIIYAINYGLPLVDNKNLASIFEYLKDKTSSKSMDIILGGAWAHHAQDQTLKQSLTTTIQILQTQGYRVSLTDDVPIFSFEPSLCKLKRLFNFVPHRCDEYSATMENRQAFIQKTLSEVQTSTGAHLLTTHDFLKVDGTYIMAKDGKVLYRDNNHLNINGSSFVAKSLKASGQLEYLSQ
ncbi:MAG: acyltransferase [Proteobacteria bacterium]|nr:MAG: acyltransferase [Pseudomonadota bacterium]